MSKHKQSGWMIVKVLQKWWSISVGAVCMNEKKLMYKQWIECCVSVFIKAAPNWVSLHLISKNMKNIRNGNGEWEFVIKKIRNIIVTVVFGMRTLYAVLLAWKSSVVTFLASYTLLTHNTPFLQWCTSHTTDVCYKSNVAHSEFYLQLQQYFSFANNSTKEAHSTSRRRFAAGRSFFFLLCVACTPKNEKWFYRCKISFPLAIQLKNGNLLVATISNVCILQNCLCLNWWKIIFLARMRTEHFPPAE